MQSGILPRCVAGHASVGAGVRGSQALEHQGAAVQEEPAREALWRAGTAAGGSWLPGAGTAGLTAGGDPRPAAAGRRPSARPRRAAAAPGLRSLTAPPGPAARCAPAGRPSSGSGEPLRQECGEVARGAATGWNSRRGRDTDLPSTATTKSLRASAWAFSATHV